MIKGLQSWICWFRLYIDHEQSEKVISNCSAIKRDFKSKHKMRTAAIPIVFLVMVLTSCESTDDILERLDHEVPEVEFMSDTVEVDAGSTLNVDAWVRDASGIERIEFSYGNWLINVIDDYSEAPASDEVTFSTERMVPEDALKSWEEEKYFNDASSIMIVQEYHPLALSAWDRNRNMRKAYLYVKVN
jgi:hypothetical protein